MLTVQDSAGIPRSDGDEIPADLSPVLVPPDPAGYSAQRYAADVAPVGAPAVAIPLGGLMPWIGDGEALLPAYSPATASRWKERTGTVPRWVRTGDALWCAWAHDVLGWHEETIGTSIEAKVGRGSQAERHSATKLRCSTVRSKIGNGRELLRSAGAWPWAAIHGEWPRRWWDDARALGSIEAWASKEWPTPPSNRPTLVGTVSDLRLFEIGAVDWTLDLIDLLEHRALERGPRALHAVIRYFGPDPEDADVVAPVVAVARPGALTDAVAEDYLRRAAHQLEVTVAVSVLTSGSRTERPTYPDLDLLELAADFIETHQRG